MIAPPPPALCSHFFLFCCHLHLLCSSLSVRVICLAWWHAALSKNKEKTPFRHYQLERQLDWAKSLSSCSTLCKAALPVWCKLSWLFQIMNQSLQSCSHVWVQHFCKLIQNVHFMMCIGIKDYTFSNSFWSLYSKLYHQTCWTYLIFLIGHKWILF